MRRLGVLAAVLFAGAAAAETVTYDCRMGGGRGPGWVMNYYNFEVDKTNLKVRVSDPMIQQFVGKPITTDLDLRGNGNMIFKWEIPRVPSTGMEVRVTYDAFINAKTLATHVEAGFPSFFGGFPPRRQGRCQVR